MGTMFLDEMAEARAAIDEAAATLFDADPAVRSVGVGRHRGRPAFVTVRNANVIVPMSASREAVPRRLLGFAVQHLESFHDPVGEHRVPHTGPGSPAVGSLVPEQSMHRPLVCGLQVQNFDDDVRTGVIEQGSIIIGTLGCFADHQGKPAMLSNNHVLAGENRGIRGKDRIFQPGSGSFSSAEHVATLTDYVKLLTSPPGAAPRLGNVVYNDVDAAIARLREGVAFAQAYLPLRTARPPSGTAVPAFGDEVHKVGRTTGLTYGKIVKTSTIVGPVGYGIGPCWFRNSFTIVGINGTMFSDRGDSGSAIVRSKDGAVLGLLYAGNGTQTYACPIDLVLSAMDSSLWSD